jgi:hypothetical protein
VRALLAINRTYAPHRRLKWQLALVEGLALTAERLDARLDGLWRTKPAVALESVEGILDEVAGLGPQWSVSVRGSRSSTPIDRSCSCRPSSRANLVGHERRDAER